MKKTLSKAFVTLVALVLVICYITSSATAAMTQEQAYRAGYDVYKAWFLSNNGSAHYLLYDYESPYKSAVIKRESSVLYKTALVSWRLATFDLKSEVDYSNKEVGYYETLLFDLLYDEKEEGIWDSLLSSFTDNVSLTNKAFNALSASAFKKVFELYGKIAKNTPISDPKVAQACQVLYACDELEDACYILDEVSDLVEYCDTFMDLVNNLAKVQAVMNCTKEISLILQNLYGNCDDLAMKQALQEFVSFTNGSLTYDQAKSIFTGRTAIAEGAKKVAETVYKKVAKAAGAYGLGVVAGQKVGKFAANALFGTSDAIASYYELRALYRFETLLRECVQNYTRNLGTSVINARKINAGITMLCKTYCAGIDGFKRFVDKNYQNGTLTEVFIGASEETYQSFVSSTNNLKRTIINTAATNETLADYSFNDAEEEFGSEETRVDILTISTGQENNIDENQSELSALSRQYYLEITHDYTLTEDAALYADLYISSGTLNLNGHSLTVYGNVFNNAGTLNCTHGSLQVNGNLYQNNGNSRLYSKSELNVDGSFYQKKGTLTADDSRMNINGNYEIEGYWTIGGGSNQESNLRLYSGASVMVGKNFSVESGSYYCYAGSEITVLGNAFITSGTVTDLMFKLYGELTVYGKFDFTDQGAGCSWLSVYGALTVYGKYWLCASRGADSINVYGKLFFYNENESDTGIVNSNFHLRSTAVVYSNSNISFYNGTCKNGCKIYSKGNVLLSDSVDNKEKITLYLNGNKQQSLYINCYYGDEPLLGTLILDNPAGMDFISSVKVQTLFNHNGNPFTLYQNGNGSSFPDYDGDKLTDEKDPHPLVGDIGIPVDIDEGIYVFHNVLNPDKVLSIENNSTEIRANIQLYDALYDQPQKFRVVNMGDYYCIQSVYNGLWLDIHSPYDGLGSNIQLWKKNTNTEEKWIFETAGNGNVLIHSLYGYYLGTDGQPENNTNIVTCAFDGTTVQQWALVKTSPYPRAEVADGIYTIHSAANATKVMDIQDNSTENRANIQLYDDQNNDVQQFIFTKHTDEMTNLEYYSIQSVYSGLWIDTKQTTAGSTIQLFNENTRKDEKWILEDAGNGNVLIRSLYDTFIDTKNRKTDNGTNVQTSTYSEAQSMKWKLHRVYSVIYDANGGTDAPAAQGKQENIDLTLRTSQPKRTGYTFVGWSTKPDGNGTSYASGATYRLNTDLALYAKWEKIFVIGDASGDGLIDLRDVAQITRYLAGGWDVTIDLTTADINKDGKVNLKDAVLLRRYLAGGWNVELV